MHYRSNDAQILRRKAIGPAGLMNTRAVLPFVPNRGRSFNVPARSAPLRFSGLGANPFLQAGGTAYTGAAAGAAAGSLILGGATTVAGTIAASAAAGSVVPIIGTAIGAVIGLVMSGVFSHRVDPEVGNFDAASRMYHQDPQSVLNIADKYLVLAGLFDLEPSQIKGNIPIYKKFGRMGEGPFVKAMCHLIYDAAQAGQITANDTIQSIYSRIVMPWINGFGYGVMSDSNGDMINLIILGLVMEYVTGMYKTRWYSVGGDFQFNDLPTFDIPGYNPTPAAPAQISPTASPTPSPVAVPSSKTATPQGPAELVGYRAGTVPATGAAINFVKGADGQFLALPSTGLMVGVAGNGAWIVQFPDGQYELQGSVLQPLPSMQNQAVTAVAQDQTGMPVVQSPVYYPSGGGGSYYSPPASVPQSVSTPVASTGISNQTLLLGGAALVVLVLMKKGAL